MATLLISSRSAIFYAHFLDWQGHVTLSWKEPVALKPHALLAVKPNVFHFFLSTWFFFCHEYPWTLNSIQPKEQKAFLGKFLEKSVDCWKSWKHSIGKFRRKNLGMPCKIVLFSGNFRKCCSIHPYSINSTHQLNTGRKKTKTKCKLHSPTTLKWSPKSPPQNIKKNLYWETYSPFH